MAGIAQLVTPPHPFDFSVAGPDKRAAMVFLLPLAWLLILFAIPLLCHLRQVRISFALSTLLATIVWGVLLVAVTEILGLFRLLSPVPAALAWGMLTMVLGLLVGGMMIRHRGLVTIRAWLPKSGGPTGGGRFQYVAIGLWVIQVLALVLVAYRYAPGTWDSMTYHLARVMEWRQNSSLQHFATANERQIQMPPFSEMIFLTTWLLSGSDRWVNFVQFFSSMISLAAVFEIAKRLGNGSRSHWAAVLFAASIPMGVLQATSTQNDYAAGMWVVIVYALGLLALQKNFEPRLILLASMPVGLGLLTKGTAAVFMAPMVLVLAIGLMINHARKLLVTGVLSLLLVLTVNSGYFARNFRTYGSILGPTDAYLNQEVSLQVLASNVLRNAALHVPVGRSVAPLVALGDAALDRLEKLHELTGLDPLDPRTTWGDQNPFEGASGTVIDENLSGNTLHLLLIMLFSILGLLSWNKLPRIQKAYFILVVLAGLAFNLVFKWQIWGSRLQLPLFLLWAPLLAGMPRLSRSRAWLLVPLALTVFSFRWIAENPARPLRPSKILARNSRTEEYFISNLKLLGPYDRATRSIVERGCERVGLKLSGNAHEYQLWLMLEQKGFSGRIAHLDVQNPSTIYAVSDFAPCAIISDSRMHGEEDPLSFMFESQGIYYYQEE